MYRTRLLHVPLATFPELIDTKHETLPTVSYYRSSVYGYGPFTHFLRSMTHDSILEDTLE